MTTNKKEQQLFTTAFGEAQSQEKCWDSLDFKDRKPKMVLRYVGWVDVMGASHMMRRSLDAASKSIGCLHEAVVKACLAQKSASEVLLHPLADGVYIVAAGYHIVAEILARAFRSYAMNYLQMESESRFSPIRAAIAYGRVGVQPEYVKKLEAVIAKDQTALEWTRYFSNVIHGYAFAAAHDAEHNAPPFGIYHDDSLRDFGKTKDETFTTWPLEKWWCKGHKASKNQQAFATAFGMRLLNHFKWVESHPYDSGLSGEDAAKKVAAYKKQIEEYFGLCDQPTVPSPCGHSTKES